MAAKRERKSFKREVVDLVEDEAVFGAPRGPEAQRPAEPRTTEEKTHRVTVVFDDATYRAMRMHVATGEGHKTMSNLIRDVVVRYFEQEGGK